MSRGSAGRRMALQAIPVVEVHRRTLILVCYNCGVACDPLRDHTGISHD
jgi:hypothetical protein